MQAKVAWCVDDAQREHTPDCMNAAEASAVRSWSRKRAWRLSIGARRRLSPKDGRRHRMWTNFFTWLTGQVNNFIATQVGTVSTLLEPAVITLASVYVMMWGYLQLTGKSRSRS